MEAATALYEQDFYAWTQEQVRLIQAGNFSTIDYQHVKEELQIMGVSEKRELHSRLTVLLMHLLKWKYQPNLQCKSWKYTIKEQRKELKYHFKNNPSLTNAESLSESLAYAYELAVLKAVSETNLNESVFAQTCEWNIQNILDEEFFPE